MLMRYLSSSHPAQHKTMTHNFKNSIDLLLGLDFGVSSSSWEMGPATGELDLTRPRRVDETDKSGIDRSERSLGWTVLSQGSVTIVNCCCWTAAGCEWDCGGTWGCCCWRHVWIIWKRQLGVLQPQVRVDQVQLGGLVHLEGMDRLLLNVRLFLLCLLTYTAGLPDEPFEELLQINVRRDFRRPLPLGRVTTASRSWGCWGLCLIIRTQGRQGLMGMGVLIVARMLWKAALEGFGGLTTQLLTVV